MDLKNLKAGQDRTEGAVTVSKADGYYVIMAEGRPVAGQLSYDRDLKTWTLQVSGHDIALPGATSATVVEMALAAWPESVEVSDEERTKKLAVITKLLANASDTSLAPEVAQAYLGRAASLMLKYGIDDEQVRRDRADAAGETRHEEKITGWSMDIDTRGGHASHRMMAFQAVIRALGGDMFYTTSGVAKGYNVRTIMHVHAHESLIEQLKVFLPTMSLAMEAQAKVEGRRVSREARLTGGHHSSNGCKARRGFMLGFGYGIADRVRKSTDEMITEDVSGSKALVIKDRANQLTTYMEQFGKMTSGGGPRQHDSSSRNRGYVAGRAFASPTVTATGGRTAIEA